MTASCSSYLVRGWNGRLEKRVTDGFVLICTKGQIFAAALTANQVLPALRRALQVLPDGFKEVENNDFTARPVACFHAA